MKKNWEKQGKLELFPKKITSLCSLNVFSSESILVPPYPPFIPCSLRAASSLLSSIPLTHSIFLSIFLCYQPLQTILVFCYPTKILFRHPSTFTFSSLGSVCREQKSMFKNVPTSHLHSDAVNALLFSIITLLFLPKILSIILDSIWTKHCHWTRTNDLKQN